MTPKQRLFFSSVASFLLLLGASACETPQPGAKPYLLTCLARNRRPPSHPGERLKH
jgi:hypothetical protein